MTIQYALWEVGSTTVFSVNVFLQDSSKASGVGLTGLAYNTPNLQVSYVTRRKSVGNIMLVNLASISSSHASGGFKEVSSVHLPGLYRFDVPVNTGAGDDDEITIMFVNAANLEPATLIVRTSDIKKQLMDANNLLFGFYYNGIPIQAPEGEYFLKQEDDGESKILRISDLATIQGFSPTPIVLPPEED